MATQNESILALLRLTETNWVPKWPIESLFDSIVKEAAILYRPQYVKCNITYCCWNMLLLTPWLGIRIITSVSLQWRHNELDDVSNHQPHDCLLNCIFRRRSKKTSKLRATGLFEGNSPVTGRWPRNSPHKGPDTRKMFPFDDGIVLQQLTPVRVATVIINFEKRRPSDADTICIPGPYHFIRTHSTCFHGITNKYIAACDRHIRSHSILVVLNLL